jgi:phosphoglycolate phosphatase
MQAHYQPGQPVDALLFDLDGTLIDTAADFIAVLHAQRLAHGLQPLDEELIRNTVSNGARALTLLAFGGTEGEAQFEKHRSELLENYLEIVGNHAALFPGMGDVLADCRTHGIPWGIITNKPRKFTEKLLDRLNLHKQCDLILCADDVSRPKPDPESMFLAARMLDIDLRNSVYVGDHERDIAAGKAADMITVTAAYGYIMDNEATSSWGADFIIQQPIELKTLFLS